MATLYMKEIGPIKEVEINLNRINVFIGPQSSGKSTMAKVVSFCNWLEKQCVLEQDVEFVNWDFISVKLVNYHNLQGYLSEDSVIRYEGDYIRFSMEYGKAVAEVVNKLELAFLSKNAYIPSERNMLALPGIFTMKMPDNYLLEFIDDWQEIRTKYTSEDKLDILNIGGSYYFNESENVDRIRLEDGKTIGFPQASSGLQSVVPLCVCVDYLTRWIYEHEENRSAADRKKYRDALTAISQKLLNEFYNLPDKGEREKIESELDDVVVRWESGVAEATHLVIEEPEQNLFPKTQLSLVYFILSKLQHKSGRDSIVITTHSPYILYALNNCILAGLAVKDNKEIEEMVKEYASMPEEAWVDPVSVSVWELADGYIKDNETIQDQRGLIRDNYFDRVMQNVMSDFNNLINFIS